MRKLAIILVILMLCSVTVSAALASSAHDTHGVSPDAAIAKLVEGNKQFAAGNEVIPDINTVRRTELINGQHPFAVVVSCSDSRVPPEEVFDQGLGQLFVVRTAGNTVDEIELGSIEYAVEHLGVQLIVVLGHEKCGAVTAAAGGGEAPGHIGALVKAIKPAVDQVKGQPGDLVAHAVDANVDLVVNQLKSSKPILSEFVNNGKVKIVGAVYDLDDGLVTFR